MNREYYSRSSELEKNTAELHPDMRPPEQGEQWEQGELGKAPKAGKSPLPLVRGLIYATILILLLAAISYKNTMLFG